jgi:hypothetical protein
LKTGQQRSRITACKKKLSGGTYVTNEIGLNVGMNASKPLKRMTAREEERGKHRQQKTQSQSCQWVRRTDRGEDEADPSAVRLEGTAEEEKIGCQPTGTEERSKPG